MILSCRQKHYFNFLIPYELYLFWLYGKSPSEIEGEVNNWVFWNSILTENYIHKPCSPLVNPGTLCMRNGQFSKGYPIAFTDETLFNERIRQVYRRRQAERHIMVDGNICNSRSVVPYNRYAAKTFWSVFVFGQHELSVSICAQGKWLHHRWSHRSGQRFAGISVQLKLRGN